MRQKGRLGPWELLPFARTLQKLRQADLVTNDKYAFNDLSRLAGGTASSDQSYFAAPPLRTGHRRAHAEG